MLNLNEKLLDLQSEIGTEAFCVLLQIARYSNNSFSARPGVFKLSKLTGLSQRKVTIATNQLQKLELISKKQLFVTEKLKEKYPKLKEKRLGAFFTNEYTITTDFISKFVNVRGSTGYDFSEEETNDSQFDDIVTDDIVTDDIVKSTNKVLKDFRSIESLEVLKEEKEATADFENSKPQNEIKNLTQSLDNYCVKIGLTADEELAWKIKRTINSKQNPQGFLDYLNNYRSNQDDFDEKKLKFIFYQDYWYNDFLAWEVENREYLRTIKDYIPQTEEDYLNNIKNLLNNPFLNKYTS
jgi:hypothetical protein